MPWVFPTPPPSSGPFISSPTLASYQHLSPQNELLSKSSDQCPLEADGSHRLYSKSNSIQGYSMPPTLGPSWSGKPRLPLFPYMLLTLVHQTKFLALTCHGLSRHLNAFFSPPLPMGRSNPGRTIFSREAFLGPSRWLTGLQ